VVKSLKEEQIKNYSSEKGFRNAMIAGNVIILLITIMGLMGYTITEVSRRRKELAIRKISGARLSDILKIFIMDLEFIAIPAVIIGLAGAWFTANKWMENFASKIPLHWGIFASCSIFVLLLIAFIATINYVMIANRNPVEALRYE
jgi:putative ABC transport system permease protein